MLISNYFQIYPEAYFITMFLLGLVVGSFLNVVIVRLPRMLERGWRKQCQEFLFPGYDHNENGKPFNLIRPRSHCPKCGQMVKALDNIPVLSYLLIKGRCRNCNNRISLRYPVVELTSGILTAWAAWYFGYNIQALFAMLFTWALICLSMVDLDHQLLPDDITLPFLWLGLVANMFGLFTDVHSSLLGAIIGYGVLWTLFVVYKVLTGKEGMGYGDFKLLALLGAWLGWQMLPIIILLSSLLGAVIGIGLIVFQKRDKNTPLPFGPYLAFSGWVAMFWGIQINSVWLGLV